MEWEEKGHEEKQGDNYLSGVGKATGIPGDTRISNNCLLITAIFPSCLFLIASVGVLSVGPLHWPGRRRLQRGPGSVPVILPCGEERDTSGMVGAARLPSRDRAMTTTAVSPKNWSAKHPVLHPNLSFAAPGKATGVGFPEAGSAQLSAGRDKPGAFLEPLVSAEPKAIPGTALAAGCGHGGGSHGPLGWQPAAPRPGVRPGATDMGSVALLPGRQARPLLENCAEVIQSLRCCRRAVRLPALPDTSLLSGTCCSLPSTHTGRLSACSICSPLRSRCRLGVLARHYLLAQTLLLRTTTAQGRKVHVLVPELAQDPNA